MTIQNYYYGDGVKIRPGNGLVKLHVSLPDGVELCDVEPRRMLPLSQVSSFISFVDSDGEEKAIIRDSARLDPESLGCLEEALSRFYMMPKIIEIKEVTDKSGVLTWKVQTDRGTFEFRISNRYSDIKMLKTGRVLIRDSNDNRYEIPDFYSMSKHSQRLLSGDL